MEPPAPKLKMKRKLKLAKQACLGCHSSKKCCADERPCPRCVKLGIECEERPVTKKRRLRFDGKKFNSTPPIPSTSTSHVVSSLPPPPIAAPPLTLSTYKTSAYSFTAPATTQQTPVLHSPSSFSLISPPSSTASSFSLQTQLLLPQRPLLPDISLEYTQQPNVNNNVLGDMLTEITALQSKLLQKVQLYNKLNAQLPQSFVPLPLPLHPLMDFRKERLKLFISTFAQHWENSVVTVWDRKTLRLQSYNGHAKTRQSMIVRSEHLTENAPYLDLRSVDNASTGGMTVELIEPFNAGTEPFVKKARWRTLLMISTIPGATLEYTALYRANEEFFAMIEEHPIITMNTNTEEPKFQEVDPNITEGGISVDLPVASGQNSVELKHIFVSKSLYDEFQVNDYKPLVRRNVLFSRKFRYHCEYLKDLKLQDAMQRLCSVHESFQTAGNATQEFFS